MKRQNYKILLIIFFLSACYAGNIFAHMEGNPSGSTSGSHRTPPAVIPKPGPPLFMQYKWSPDDVINIFNANGLEVQDIKPLTTEDYSSLPAKAKEAIKFTIPSNGEHAEGCILSFERRDDMEKIAGHYRKLNKKDKLHSWTFTRDNVLVVLKGEIPGKRARLYEDALKKLHKKQ
jgi:hypothetical protein